MQAKKGDSRCIKEHEFLSIQAGSRPFTRDGFADDDGVNTMCDVYNSPCNPFCEQSLTASHTWVNPPFHLIGETLKHYLKEKCRSPKDTSACFLVPDWPETSWNPLVRGMQLMRTYPMGYPLYNMKYSDGRTEVVKGIPWPVKVYYDAPYEPAALNRLQGAEAPVS